jgi:hypothetical protein
MKQLGSPTFCCGGESGFGVQGPDLKLSVFYSVPFRVLNLR